MNASRDVRATTYLSVVCGGVVGFLLAVAFLLDTGGPGYDVAYAQGYDWCRTCDAQDCHHNVDRHLPSLFGPIDEDAWLDGCLHGAADWERSDRLGG